MAHDMSYNLSSHLEAQTATTHSQPAATRVWSHVRQAVSGISGEHIAGAILTTALTVWTGWLMWALAQAIETYRIF